MSENVIENKEVSLTLEPTAIPTVNMDGVQTPIPEAPTDAVPKQALAEVGENIPAKLDDSSLTEEEKKIVDEFAKQIDISNTNQILMFGSNAQKKISDFSEQALRNVKAKDSGEIGKMITDLVVQLDSFSPVEDKPKGFAGFFRKSQDGFKKMQASYTSVEKNIDNIVNSLQNHQIQLMKDIAMLDQMYEANIVYYKELTMYILAGKKRLAELETVEVPKLREAAKLSGRPEDAQKANDFASLCNRFDKKLHDLELTRIISIQMAPQIRMIQNNDTMMVEKIQSSILNTIPLWKNQMVLALGMDHGKRALEAQRQVTDMTNKLLQQNADTLKMGTVETAREAERSVVDLDTLKHTNKQLIATLDEVVQIQEEGRAKRREAEAEIARIEGELKVKLLDLKIEQEREQSIQK